MTFFPLFWEDDGDQGFSINVVNYPVTSVARIVCESGFSRNEF